VPATQIDNGLLHENLFQYYLADTTTEEPCRKIGVGKVRSGFPTAAAEKPEQKSTTTLKLLSGNELLLLEDEGYTKSDARQPSILGSHHAEALVNPKVRELKKRLLILDTPEHVDSENIKLKIGSRSLLYLLISKRDLKIHKMWLKLAKIDHF
jgi:hypothetical protein